MKQYTQSIEIRWADLDANMHVANTRYNLFATDARVGYLMANGYQFGVHNSAGPVVLSDSITYRRELRLGDKITVKLLLRGISPKGTKWIIQQILEKEGGEVAAIIDSFGGWLDLETRKLTRPPKGCENLFLDLEKCDNFEQLLDIKGVS